ncbi:hypothetical protein [Minwuia sp. IMCC3077]|uniref:hypothetical protein n=1 Tax=Minwuia sp. IMCC3077 TaxID=3040676 RepID=UPI00247A312C|nr:hypothetical protein [Minwuia sp. IMCC3077]
MGAALSDFEWLVSAEGYEWRVGSAATPPSARSGVSSIRETSLWDRRQRFANQPDEGELLPALTWRGIDSVSDPDNGLPPPQTLANRPPGTYRPFVDTPALFREFAALPLHPASILAFANQWGDLGGSEGLMFCAVDHTGERLRPNGYYGAEPLVFWFDAISEMKLAVDIWTAVLGGRDDQMAGHVRWDPSGGVRWRLSSSGSSALDWASLEDRSEGESELIALYERHLAEPSPPAEENVLLGHLDIASADHHPERTDLLWEARSERIAARFLVQDMVNEALLGCIDPVLHFAGTETAQGISMKPTGLLAAMWLQFALAIDGNIDFRQCSVCRSWFEIAPGRGRPEKSYCSDACRMRAYRKRKAEQAQR